MDSKRYAKPDGAGVQKISMFLCKVLLGDKCKGVQGYTKGPPNKPGSAVQYDSMCNVVNNPTVVVIAKDYQALPVFLVSFKRN